MIGGPRSLLPRRRHPVFLAAIDLEGLNGSLTVQVPIRALKLIGLLPRFPCAISLPGSSGL